MTKFKRSTFFIPSAETKSSAFHKSDAKDTPYITDSLPTARQQKYSIEGMSLFSDAHNRNPSPCDPNLARFLLPPLIIDLLFNAVLFSTHATAWINCIGHIIKKKKIGMLIYELVVSPTIQRSQKFLFVMLLE